MAEPFVFRFAPGEHGEPEVMYVADVRCECGTTSKVQANLGAPSPLQEGCWAYPADDLFHCPECMRKADLKPARRQVEEQTGKAILA